MFVLRMCTTRAYKEYHHESIIFLIKIWLLQR